MTAWGSIQLAVQGMQAGAFDFITKPWNNAALLQRIETAQMCIRDRYNGTFRVRKIYIVEYNGVT